MPVRVRDTPSCRRIKDDFGVGDMPEIEKILGYAQQHLVAGRLERAKQNYLAAVAQDSNCIVAHYALGTVHFQQHRYSEAAQSYQRVIELFPDYPDAYDSLGVALMELGQYEQAIPNCRQAVMLRPDRAEFVCNLACAYQHEGRLTDAARLAARGIELRPNWPEAYYNLASIQREVGDLSAAIANNQKALDLRPDFLEARWNLCHTYLLDGQLAQGWQEWDWWECNLKGFSYGEEFTKPRWDGTSFLGKRLLVQWQGGIGDNLQFLRYLPLIKERGGTVVLEVPASLRSLLRDVAGVDELIEVTPGHLPHCPFDLYVPLLGVAKLFQTTLDSIPNHVPYLSPSGKDVLHMRQWISTVGLKVGIVWSGDPNNGNNARRSCPPRHFLRLTRLPGVCLFSLQKGPAAADLAKCRGDIPVIDLAPHLHDFADTAAALELLDLIITVDTAVLHLAGAMGKVCWGLLTFAPDWRWMLGRSDTPWYPTMTLFRPDGPGDWESLFGRVECELRQRLAAEEEHHLRHM